MENKRAEDSSRVAAIRRGLGSVLVSAKQITSNAASKAVKAGKPLIVLVLQPALRWLQIRWRVIRPARVGLILSVAVSLFLLLNDQATDILRVIAQGEWFKTSNWVLCVGLLVYASTAWYFSRATLYVFYKSFTPEDSAIRFERLRKYTARLIGGLPIAALAIAFIGISWPHSIFYFVTTVLFLLVLELRREYLLPKLYPTNEKGKIYIGLHHDEGLTDRTRPIVIGIFIIAFIVFVGILLMPVSFPTRVGTLGVVFLGAAGLIVMSNLLTYWSDYYDLPSLIFIVILTAVFAGLYNDNHAVRILQNELKPSDRQTLVAHFEKWMEKRLTLGGSKDKKYPVFVVAAEGGGIRAAYWTAAMLIELQKRYPDFPCHTFAISGVSGGSLGGSAFVADLANAYRSEQFRCTEPEKTVREKTAGPGMNEPIRSTTLAFLGEDFLAPTVGGLLFPDLISRVNVFCPWLFCFPDRASYLEWAWEENWAKHNKGAPLQFSGDFLDLWKEDGVLEIPSLVLNGTWVEDGRRNVTSNLKPQAKTLTDVDDMLANFEQRIPLSSAVHMSARFTYVSPAGTVRTKPAGKKRVVDGGYFENSGALSARQILDVLRDTCANNETLSSFNCIEKVSLYAVIISNNPKNPNAEHGARLAKVLPDKQQEDPKKQQTSTNLTDTLKDEEPENSIWRPLLSETLSPLVALYHTRTARGSLSEAELVAAMQETHSLRFQLLNPLEGNEIPLGWVFSKQTQDEIRRQAKSRMDEYEDKLQATGLRENNRVME